MQLSLQLLRDEGWSVFIVEHWDHYARKRKDLLGMFDILALKRKQIMGVQATSLSNVSARIRKITNHENLPIAREAGFAIEVHGWGKKDRQWACRREDLS